MLKNIKKYGDLKKICTYSFSISSKHDVVLANVLGCVLSLNSDRWRSSEFIWRVLIFSVVFLTKLETLKKKVQWKLKEI